MIDKVSSSDQEYWALKSTAEIGDALCAKVRQYYRFIQESNRISLYRRAYQMYYSPALEGAQLNFTGLEGELVQITVNDYRNLITHLITLITSQRPSFECRASNTDHKSDAQCILGQALVDYYLREKKVENYLKLALEMALSIYGEAFISVPWNATIGNPVGRDPETGVTVKDGDIELDVFGPLHYVRDFSKDSAHGHYWGIPVRKRNKYELAAKYPEYADILVGLTMSPEIFDGMDIFWDYYRAVAYAFETDEIPVFTFYHKKSDALPQGREVFFLSDGTVIYDEPLPYDDVPVYRMACADWHGTPFGYTVGYDLMPVQEMTDALDSAICSNQNAFAVTNLWAAPGQVPEATNIAGGLRLLQCPTKPEVLQLMGTAPEVFQYREALIESKSRLAGLDPVTLGNPTKDLSGSAMALLQSTSVQFSIGTQQSYVSALEDVGTAIINRLRVFAKVPRVAAIAGKNNKQFMEEFVGDDISMVDRVLVDQGNPLMNTTSGKMNLADKLLEHQMIQTPEEYLMVYTTGRLEPLYQNLQSELMLIKQENEQLSEGINPPVLITDNPLIHLKEHQVVANSPEARNDPQIMQAYTQHQQDHINLWRGHLDPQSGQWINGIDPALAGMLGIPSPPPPPQPPGMGPPPGAQPPPPQPGHPALPTRSKPQGMLPPQGEAMNPSAPGQPQSQAPKKPRMPHAPAGSPPGNAQIIANQAPV